LSKEKLNQGKNLFISKEKILKFGWTPRSNKAEKKNFDNFHNNYSNINWIDRVLHTGR
jgi:hypothetical protein